MLPACPVNGIVMGSLIKSQPQPSDFCFDHWFATQNNAAPP